MTISALLFTLAGAYGVWLIYTAIALRWTGVAPGPDVGGPRRRAPSLRDWLAQAGLADVEPREFAAVVGALFLLSALGCYALFGGGLPAPGCGGSAATLPPASYRARRDRRMATAREAWPRMIEELRVLTGSVGRSIPQALFEVGRRGPTDLRPAFAAAEREWLLSTDFART